MLLGKRQRPRPPMKRTTSMMEFTLDLNHTTALHNPSTLTVAQIHRRSSGDYTQTAHFLRACHLCNRQLIGGRDIFMYRGDSAFCSLECRQQQMNEDDEKKDNPNSPSPSPSHTHLPSNAPETATVAIAM